MDTSRLFIERRSVWAFADAVQRYAQHEALMEESRGRVNRAMDELETMLQTGQALPVLSADAVLLCCEVASHILARPEAYPMSKRAELALRRALAEGRDAWESYQQSEAAFGKQGDSAGCLGLAWQVIGGIIGLCGLAIVLGCVFSLF